MIRADLGKAAQALDVARLLIDTGSTDDAMNRAYYSVFHTTKALVEFLNPDLSSRSHRGVITAFNDLYVRTGRLPKEYGAKIGRASSARHVADYENQSVTSSEANEHIAFAQEFLGRALQLVPSAEHPSPRPIRLADVLRDEAAKDGLAKAFCELAQVRGETIPSGFASELALYGSVETLTRLIAHIDQMTDLKSYVKETVQIPSLG